MASRPVELRDVTPSSQSLIDHQQSLLPAPDPYKGGYPETSSAETGRHSSRSTKWHAMPWKFEILSWITSLCFFVGIIVALVLFNGRAIPNLPLGINPNAIIQILATFAEFFMMIPVTSAIGQMKWLRSLQVRPVYEFRAMDEASRGPWGSFVLLLRRTGGVIASFGAAITIITLATGTFVQQALKYDTVYVNTSTNAALVPVARYMNGTGSAEYSGTDASTNGVDPEVASGAYVGLFNSPRADFPTSAKCSTGNCTWESYRTLAICNTCANLTSSLKITKEGLESKFAKLPPIPYTTDYYVLPNGVLLNGRQQDADSPTSPLMKALMNITTTLQPITIGGGEVVSSIAFANNASALLSVFAIGVSPGKIPAEPDAKDNMTGDGYGTPVAFECLLQFCVQEFRSEFNNGTLQETLVSTWTNNTQVAEGLIGYLNNQDAVLTPPDSGESFVATASAVEGTSSWLNNLVTGNAHIFTNEALSLDSVSTTAPQIQPIFAAMNSSATGFPDMMDNLARSISHSLRTLSYQPGPASGIAFSPTTRATIVWPWMTLPFFLLAASLVFLVMVMVETKRKGLVPWTNNILAALFHGLDKRSNHHWARETEHIMEDEARSLLVEFQTHEGGGRLAVAK